MKNLYIYPTALKHSQDKSEKYYNTTPLSEQGIKDHFKITEPEKADYFYMGQISCGTYKEFKSSDFSFFEGNEKRHLVELEGDWLNDKAPDWLLKCTCMGNANRTFYNKENFFTRPCLSTLLIHLAKNTEKIKYELTLPDTKSFGFKGQVDPYGTRIKVAQVLNAAGIPNDIEFNPGWFAQVDLKSDNNIVQGFAKKLENNIFSLCPRGAGEDTIRFYESCFFGRVPIIIGCPKIMCEDDLQDIFFYRIDPNLSNEEMAKEFKKIHDTPLPRLHDMCRLARKYFEEVVVEYFKDPTLMVLDFLKKVNNI